MAYTEFYCDTASGTDVNGGSDSGSPSMSDTAGTGGWVSTTNIYTSVATNGAVAVGQWLSIYTGSTFTYAARITAVSGGSGSAWVITVSGTAIIGSKPGTASNFKAQVGGAWKGPNGATITGGYTLVTTASTNAAGSLPRVNYKTSGTYSISASYALSNGGVTHEGFTTAAGDQGQATIDASTNVIDIVTLSGSVALANLIVQNNGTTGTKAAINIGAVNPALFRVVCNTVRGPGVLLAPSNTAGFFEECEFYGCNSSNTVNSGGVVLAGAGAGTADFINCVFHDNAGSNNNGVVFTTATSPAYASFVSCIFDTNGSDGVLFGASVTEARFVSCDFYNNGRDGVELLSIHSLFRNCNFVKNGRYGVEIATSPTRNAFFRNCGFGSGTQANSSGTISSSLASQEIGSITYVSGVTPWVDPANGDFRINLAAAKGTGRGGYTETAASYTGTVGYPDIGAAQHADPPAGGASYVEG